MINKDEYSWLILLCARVNENQYEGPAKSSVTNRFLKFYPRYILKCFTVLEWCVEQLTIPVYVVQTAFQLTSYFQLKQLQSYTLTNLLVTIRNDQAKDNQESTFYMTTPPLISVRLLSLFLASEKVKVLNHPPYSPDLSPCDFFLFQRLKKMLSGNKYTSRSSLGSAAYQCLQQRCLSVSLSFAGFRFGPGVGKRGRCRVSLYSVDIYLYT